MSKRKNKKLDTTIIVALIGLAGTILTAMFSSPILKGLVERTPMPEAANSSTNPGPTPVFSEDFEKGYASGLSYTSEEWQVMKEKGDYVLELRGAGNTNNTVSFGPNDFSNGSIEFQLFFRNFDGFILNFRSNMDVETYVLYLAPTYGEIKMGYGGTTTGWNLEPFETGLRSFNFLDGVWYKIKLEATDTQFVLWVDDKKLLSCQDSRLSVGGMEFSVQYDGSVLLDDIAVFQSSP